MEKAIGLVIPLLMLIWSIFSIFDKYNLLDYMPFENDFNIIKAHYDTGHLTIGEYTSLLEILMEQCIRNKEVYEEGIEDLATSPNTNLLTENSRQARKK